MTVPSAAAHHARDANLVRTDGAHTVAEVSAQMAYLREVRGPGQHAQLIGGEVTLLGPEHHAAALEAMRAQDRKPMSMTHGNFDYDYLERLRAERGVRFDLAHNMTVTPRNLAEVAEVVRACPGMRFGMLSFQPAAYVGNPARWREDFRAISIDDVWREIERGAGTRLPWRHMQMGDGRCNRTAYGVLAGGRWTALLDDGDARDLRVRDAFLDRFGGMDFERSPAIVAVAVARVAARHPQENAVLGRLLPMRPAAS